MDLNRDQSVQRLLWLPNGRDQSENCFTRRDKAKSEEAAEFRFNVHNEFFDGRKAETVAIFVDVVRDRILG